MWPTSPAFTDVERAALASTDAFADGAVPVKFNAALNEHFDEQARVKLTLTSSFLLWGAPAAERPARARRDHPYASRAPDGRTERNITPRNRPNSTRPRLKSSRLGGSRRRRLRGKYRASFVSFKAFSKAAETKGASLLIHRGPYGKTSPDNDTRVALARRWSQSPAGLE